MSYDPKMDLDFFEDSLDSDEELGNIWGDIKGALASSLQGASFNAPAMGLNVGGYGGRPMAPPVGAIHPGAYGGYGAPMGGISPQCMAGAGMGAMMGGIPGAVVGGLCGQMMGAPVVPSYGGGYGSSPCGLAPVQGQLESIQQMLQERAYQTQATSEHNRLMSQASIVGELLQRVKDIQYRLGYGKAPGGLS